MDYGFYIIIGITMAIVIPYFIRLARRRTWREAGGKSQRHGRIITSYTLDQARQAILGFAQSGGYTIEESEGEKIVISDQPTATSWGFFYPITFFKQSDGTLQVNIGIKSKLMQFGPVVSRHHKKIIAEITVVLQNSRR